MTLNQAKAAYKKSSGKDAPEDWTIEQITAELEKIKAEKAQAKAEADAKAKADKEAQAKAKAEADAKAKAPKFKVNFGVEIPEMKKTYIKADLEANEEICEYLHEIGSGAVTKL